jgi:phosphomannomutase / phosphoglucomutase
MTSPWKACDIRGIYPDEVNPELLFRIGQALGSMLPQAARVVVAGDHRISTPSLMGALTTGLLRVGIQVLDAGQIPTPVAYFAHQHWHSEAVLVVTASHNPAHCNGLKLMVGQNPPTPPELENLRQIAETKALPETPGRLERIDPLPFYREWVLQRWAKTEKTHPLEVVLDAGNGVWSEIGPNIFETLGFRVHQLFCEIDGRFPNRPPDCARPRNLVALSRAVRERGAQLGIAWDGDGDRVAFADETGTVVTADELSILLVRDMLSGHPSAKVVHDIKLSDVVRQTVVECGGYPIMECSGHTFVKRRMIQETCLLGCESSGHYFFQELNGGDDGLFAALFVSGMVHRNGSLCRQRHTVPPIYITPDLRLPISSLTFETVAWRLRERFRNAVENTLDGLRLQITDGFVLIRESVTEPALTMRLEGFSRTSLERMINICLNAFPEVAEDIQRQLNEM